MDANVLIQGLELNIITVPLHKMYLHSDLIIGPVVVGIRPTLPLKIQMPVHLVTNLIITLNVTILLSQVKLTEVVSLMTYPFQGNS